jgi:oxygen-independent coproporphyrinogen-3 oxidase
MNLQAKEKRPLTGLYVHIPFCASTCDFCGFYQQKPRENDFDRFLDGIEAELAWYPSGVPISTHFWGGGTPGLLGPREMGRLGALVNSYAGNDHGLEWSVEMAPAFVTRRKLEALREMGVNRISLGVQSFDPAVLDDLGRQHRPEQVYRAIERVKACGFENFNIDLIFGSPRQTLEQWQQDLSEAVRMEPAHISTYCLTFEEDTALFVRLSEGKVSIDPDREAGFYERSWAFLESCGYAQYEVSNFSRPGYECIHNLHTWEMEDLIGLRPSAASQYGGKRYQNIPDLDQWLKGLEVGTPRRVEEMDADPDLLAEDALVFGIRRNAGVRLDEWSERFDRKPGPELWAKWNAWVEEGLLEPLLPKCLKLTLKGRLLADSLGAELMGSRLERPLKGALHQDCK